MRQFWSICRNTFIQTVRQPIYGILILITFGLLVLSLPLSGWSMGEGSSTYQKSDQKMLVNLGLASLLAAGLFIAAFSASAALSREIEDKTALTVISKPVSRSTFVLGKFFGVAGAVALAFYLCSLVFLMTVRHQVMSTASDPYDVPVIVLGLSSFGLAVAAAFAGNYFFDWPFTTAGIYATTVLMSVAMGLIGFVGKEWKIVPFGTDIDPQLLVGMVLIFMVVMILAALAVATSTRLGQLATLLSCVAFLVVGTIHGPIFDTWVDQAPLAHALAWVAPNLTFFYQLDPLMKGQTIPASFTWLAIAYGLLYVAALLAIGIGLFQRRQLEAETATQSVPSGVALLAWAGRAGAVAAAVVALVLLSMKDYHTTGGLLTAGGVLAGSVLAWIIMVCFGRGSAWSYWVVLLGCLGATAVCAGMLLVPGMKAWSIAANPIGLTAGAIIAAGIAVVLVLPKTRRHFSSV